MLLCGPDGGTSAGPPLCNQLTHRRHELDRHVHRSVRRRLVGGFIFRYRFFIGLGLVMLQNTAHALFVPASGIFRLPHCRLLRRRRSALSALGPSWYAVTTKTNPASGQVRRSHAGTVRPAFDPVRLAIPLVLVDPPWVDEARLRLPTLLRRGERCAAAPSPDRRSNELARRDAIAISRLIQLDQSRYAGACTHNVAVSGARSASALLRSYPSFRRFQVWTRRKTVDGRPYVGV